MISGSSLLLNQLPQQILKNLVVPPPPPEPTKKPDQQLYSATGFVLNDTV